MKNDNGLHGLTTRVNQFWLLKDARRAVWMTLGIPASKKGTETGFELDSSGRKPQIKDMANKEQSIRWGIIGCGNVTEKKSGPAFNKVANSRLIAVTRRDAAKAEDYAKRHNITKWYSNADDLINDPEINAIYVATPPASHEDYVRMALKAGKYVYVEKPVTTSVASCKRMIELEEIYKGRLCVAHYRRALPYFKEIKNALEQGLIGKVKMVKLNMFQPYRSDLIAKTDYNWRIEPAISGGGLFFDLAPHQVDILIWLLGDPTNYSGLSLNQSGIYAAEDTVTGTIQFSNNILFSGNWCFTMPEYLREDTCKIIGEKGTLKFSVFGNQFQIENAIGRKSFDFVHPEHIQQPLIQKVVDFFLDKDENPCSASEALKSMQVMEAFIKKMEK
jgi:predicted dehydrogenase